MTHLQGTELDTILVTIKQEENIMNAIESFHTAFIFNSLPVFEITAAFLGDVYVPVEETDSAAVRGHVLKRLTGLISDAAEIAALKAEYEAEGGDFPKHVRGRPTAVLSQTAKLFPDILHLN